MNGLRHSFVQQPSNKEKAKFCFREKRERVTKRKSQGSSSTIIDRAPSRSSALQAGIDLKAWYLPLYHAALEGDWNSGEMFIREDLEAIRDVRGYTTLHYAAQARCLCAMKAMVRKNLRLV
ncbi:hypothetical protein Nepgr_025266 [Nepenthes gracilis]|uniref:Uncharacterized protein n=1 Tax=Nepenthes gracilis TaxID=150966 RepID=A0AAD3T5T5_NEPGR|nr:hypothetical protein Nepgr_025266 [Nepenthes gracilis]